MADKERDRRLREQLEAVAGASAPRVQPKFRHPETEQTWSGRGLMPRWLREELNKGKRLVDFAVDDLERARERLSEALSEVPFSLATLVQPIGHSRAGPIIQVVGPAFRAILKLLSSDPDGLHRLSWRTVEELVAGAYAADGYDVILTPRSGDFGRDLIAEKRGLHAIRILGQVKAYSPGRLVAADDLRALQGVVASDAAASKGVLATTSRFAPGVLRDPGIAPWVPTRLQLVDGTELADWLLSLGPKLP